MEGPSELDGALEIDWCTSEISAPVVRRTSESKSLNLLAIAVLMNAMLAVSQ